MRLPWRSGACVHYFLMRSISTAETSLAAPISRRGHRHGGLNGGYRFVPSAAVFPLTNIYGPLRATFSDFPQHALGQGLEAIGHHHYAETRKTASTRARRTGEIKTMADERHQPHDKLFFAVFSDTTELERGLLRFHLRVFSSRYTMGLRMSL